MMDVIQVVTLAFSMYILFLNLNFRYTLWSFPQKRGTLKKILNFIFQWPKVGSAINLINFTLPLRTPKQSLEMAYSYLYLFTSHIFHRFLLPYYTKLTRYIN